MTTENLQDEKRRLHHDALARFNIANDLLKEAGHCLSKYNQKVENGEAIHHIQLVGQAQNEVNDLVASFKRLNPQFDNSDYYIVVGIDHRLIGRPSLALSMYLKKADEKCMSTLADIVNKPTADKVHSEFDFWLCSVMDFESDILKSIRQHNSEAYRAAEYVFKHMMKNPIA